MCETTRDRSHWRKSLRWSSWCEGLSKETRWCALPDQASLETTKRQDVENPGDLWEHSLAQKRPPSPDEELKEEWRKSANPQSARRVWAVGGRHRLSEIQACLWGNFSPSHQIRETETHPRKQERSRLAASGCWTELVRRPERAPACFKGECRVACQCVFAHARVCECFELVLTPYVFSLQISEV